MPRNNNGIYSLPQAPFVPGTVISSAAVNSNYTDIATALTGSIASNGVTTITAAIKFFAGSAAAPSITFTADPTTGFYSSAVGQIGVAIAGVGVGNFETDGSGGLLFSGNFSVGGTLTATGNATVDGNLTVDGNISVGGTFTFANLTWTGATQAGGDITAAVSSNQNDYAPTGIAGATAIRLNCTAVCSITGLSGGAAGREIILENVGTATVQFPANSGSSLAANRFANTFNLYPTATITLRYDSTSSLWRPQNIATAFSSCALGAVSNDLLITTTGNTGAAITAGSAILTDVNGNAIKFESISVAINTTTTGPGGCDTGTRAASTQYFYWLVSDGTNINAVASTSSVKATMLANLANPAGGNSPNYIYAKRCGGNFTDGSSNLYRVTQNGQDAIYVVTAATNTANLRQMAIGPAGSLTAPAWVAVAVGSFILSTASKVSILGRVNNSNLMIAPNNSYGADTSISNPPPFVLTGASIEINTYELQLESSNFYFAGFDSNAFIFCRGWKDTI